MNKKKILSVFLSFTLLSQSGAIQIENVNAVVSQSVASKKVKKISTFKKAIYLTGSAVLVIAGFLGIKKLVSLYSQKNKKKSSSPEQQKQQEQQKQEQQKQEQQKQEQQKQEQQKQEQQKQQQEQKPDNKDKEKGFTESCYAKTERIVKLINEEIPKVMSIEELMNYKACDIEYFYTKKYPNGNKDGLVWINADIDNKLKYRSLPNLNLEKGSSFGSGNACWLISAIHLIASNPTLCKKIQSDKNLNGDSKDALIKLIGYVNKENDDLTLNDIIKNMGKLGYKGEQDEAARVFKDIKQLNFISLDVRKKNGEISQIERSMCSSEDDKRKFGKNKNNEYFIFYSSYGVLNSSLNDNVYNDKHYFSDNVQINGESYKANAVIMYNGNHYVCCKKIGEDWYVFDDGREPRKVGKDEIFCEQPPGKEFSTDDSEVFSTAYKGNYDMCIALYVKNK